MIRSTWQLILISAFATLGCNSEPPPTSNPTAKPVTTISSFADASRRLELRGYSYARESNRLGMHFVNYTKNTSNASYSVELIRWSGDPRLMQLVLNCRTNQAAFNSKELLLEIWDTIDADVCVMIDEQRDFVRAVQDMKNIDGQSRFEGRATTVDGWQICIAIWDNGFYEDAGTKENKIPMATVQLTHLETAEDMPASAELEANREVEDAMNQCLTRLAIHDGRSWDVGSRDGWLKLSLRNPSGSVTSLSIGWPLVGSLHAKAMEIRVASQSLTPRCHTAAASRTPPQRNREGSLRQRVHSQPLRRSWFGGLSHVEHLLVAQFASAEVWAVPRNGRPTSRRRSDISNSDL